MIRIPIDGNKGEKGLHRSSVCWQGCRTDADTLYPRIIAKYLPGWLDQPEELVLIEHYIGIGGEWGRRQHDTFDRVTFSNWRPRIRQGLGQRFVAFGDPQWAHLREDRLAILVGVVE